MWKYKDSVKDSIFYVRGYGQIDTNKVDVDVIHKLSLLPQYSVLAKFIEKDEKANKKGDSK
jgi:hypothetical protein